MLRFYNTLTRKKEVFKPFKKGIVGIYSCGPTVYDFAHIGNFRSYIFADILKRYLEYKGYEVKHIMNITDIDDKTIKRSKVEKKNLKELTRKYIQEFFKDLKILNIRKSNVYPRATEHIKEMISAVEVLEKKGYAYEKLHSVYFNISKFKDYGKLSRIDLKKIKPGARVDLEEYEKEHPADFTLFKRSTLDELKRGIFYQTKWGKVRPGWHLECSVMSMKYLGETFDIHTGGIDLIFPHHENEIAQSQALTGKKFVNFWLHNEHLFINGKKMSKSLGNYYTLRDLIKKGFSWQTIRYFLISTYYKQRANLTFKKLEVAEKSLKRINDFIEKLYRFSVNKGQSSAKSEKQLLRILKETNRDFEMAMDDDLNTPKALAAFFDFIKRTNKVTKMDAKTAKQFLNLVAQFDSVLGLKILERKRKKVKIPKEVLLLIKQREKLRQRKQWKLADEIRKNIKETGFWIEDTEEGPKIRRI
ncbi:MAG: cysteine--tRNA ligase [Minisyncoccales bacterium]